MNVYKVVTKLFVEGVEAGFVSSDAFGDAQIRYVIGEEMRAPKWLEDKGYFPLAFADKRDALIYAGINDVILVCECNEADVIPFEALPPRLDMDYLSIQDSSVPNDYPWWFRAIMVKKLTPVRILER